LPNLPAGEDALTDPLEQVFDVPPSEPRIRLGDTVYLRAFNGRYLDVDGPHVRARWSDRGKWQQFVLCPFGCTNSTTASSSLCDGDVVSLLAHNNRYLGVKDAQVSATWEKVEDACLFVVRTECSDEIVHRSPIYLQSCVTSRVLAPNESDPSQRDRLMARWEDFGIWQRLVVEKPLSSAVTPHRPRRRSSFPGQQSFLVRSATAKSMRLSIQNQKAGTSSSRCSLHKHKASLQKKKDGKCRISIGSSATPQGEQQVNSQAPRRRSSSAAGLAPATPVRLLRRRSSIGSCSVRASSAQREQTAAVIEWTVAATTPSKQTRSLDLQELMEVPTPSRRRAMVQDAVDLATSPKPKDLTAMFGSSEHDCLVEA